MKKIAILASGNGSNAENIYKFFANGSRVRVPLVIYDRKNAGVADRMAKYPDVKTIYIPKSTWVENPQAIVDLLHKEDIDLVVMAGFLRFAPKELTEAYAGKMLNIHPSLIPAHCGPGMYGEKVHESVIAAGDKKSGVTVHYVSEVIDGGEILMQEEVEVTEGETPESLAQKIHAVEYTLYPRAIVAALARLDSETPGNQDKVLSETEESISYEEVTDSQNHPTDQNPPSIPGVTPPPSPSEEWAETLGVNYNPEKVFNNDESVQPSQPSQPSQFSQNSEPSQISEPSQEKMPSTYLVWSVIMTVLCCLPAGVVAIIFSCQVSSKFYAGDFAGAVQASERAQIWIIVSFVLGVMANTLYIPLMLLFE